MLSLKNSLKVLKKTKALLEGHFILSSGLHSAQYVQCAKLLSYPKLSENFIKSLASKIKKKIKKIVLVGGEEVLMAKNIIKNNNINVILNRVHRLPSKVGSSIYEPYTQAKLLHENEILFCFSYEGDMEVMGSRNLPFTAGTSVAYGLDYNIAIKSLTLNAAKILGIDNIKLG